MRKKMKTEHWWLEKVEPFSNTSLSQCLHISNYKLKPIKQLRQELKRPISSLRNLVVTYEMIIPGEAKGILNHGGNIFELYYAWGGLMVTGRPFIERLSFTVAVKGINVMDYFNTIADRINKEEGYRHSFSKIFPFMADIKHYNSKEE